MNKKNFFVSLILMIIILPKLSADRFVGYVTDEDGFPMSYTSVYVKHNPYAGTMTDENGRYALEVDMTKDGKDKMVFSFIGYKTEEASLRRMAQDSVWYVTLVEQPIMLDGATVMTKISKKQSRKITQQVLEKFIARVAVDFPARQVDYPVFSSFDGSQSNRKLMHHEVIGTITEYPIKNRKKQDSVALKVNSSKEYTSDSMEEGYDKFNDMANEKINSPKNIKKRNRRPNKFHLRYTKRSLNAQAIRMHRFLWGGPTSSIIDMVDTKHSKKWNYTMIGNDNVLTYTESKNYLGIVKVYLQIHFYVDPTNYSIQKIAQGMSGEVHIPFGYKLKEEELDLINTLQIGYDTLEHYKARHAYVNVKRNVFFNKRDGHKVVREKNLSVNVNIISNKKEKLHYSARAKAIVSGRPKVKNKK